MCRRLVCEKLELGGRMKIDIQYHIYLMLQFLFQAVTKQLTEF